MSGKIMKLTSLLTILSMLLQCTSSAKQPLAWSELDIAAISRMSPHQLELLAEGLAAEELIRAKRSGSVQSLAQIASKSSSGFSSKLGLLGQASAGASSFIGSASSKGDEHGYNYGPAESPKYNFWTLKKSILNTLFQAVKAITGGVTILKGQLIKGGGALASVAGKVISGKGDAVTNLGKNIVNSAQLSPPKKHHSSPPAHYGPPPVEYIPATAYGPPSAPSLQYGAPSAPSGPSKYTAHYEGRDKDQLSGLHAGLILLKPLGQEAHDSGPPPDVHTAPSGPSAEHVALEPPQSIVSSAFQALKGVIDSVGPLSMFQIFPHSTAPAAGPPTGHDYPPPPTHSTSFDHHDNDHNSIFNPPPAPHPTAIAEPASFKPHNVFNSYGLPVEKPAQYFHSFPSAGYVPPLTPFDQDTGFGPTKLSLIPDSHYVTAKVSRSPPYPHSRLTQEKINKITQNIKKLAALDRSSESMRLFDPIHIYQQMTHKKKESNRSSNVSDVISPRSFPEAQVDFQVDSVHEVIKEDSKSNERQVNTDRTTRTHTKRSSKDSTETSDTGKVAYILRGNKIVKIRLNND